MKLYLVTRADLPPGARAAQLVHAFREFVREHPAVERDWYIRSNTIVLLEAPNELALVDLAERARTSGSPVSLFVEPDLDNALTAIALGPCGKGLVRELPLALQGPSLNG